MNNENFYNFEKESSYFNRIMYSKNTNMLQNQSPRYRN